MTKNNSAHIIYALIAALIVGAASILILDLFDLTVDSFFSSNKVIVGNHSVINFTYNTFFAWQLDEFWLKFLPVTESTYFISLNLAILSFGLYLLIFTWHQNKQSRIKAPKSEIKVPELSNFYTNFYAVTASILLPLAILFLFGLDTTVLSTIIWLPLLIVALYYFYNFPKNSSLTFLILIFFSIRNAQSALYLSLIPAILSYVIVTKPKGCRTSRVWLGLAVVLLPAIYMSLTTQLPLFPDYPLTKSGLAEDDGIPGFLRPLFGPELPLPVISRNHVSSTFIIPIFILISSIYFYRRFCRNSYSSKRSTDRFLYNTLMAMSLAVLLDVILSEPLAQIAPLSTVSRLIPGFFLVPLTPIIVSILILLLSLYFSTVLPLALTILALIVAPVGLTSLSFPNLSFPKFSEANSDDLFKEFQSIPELSEKLLSPSYHLIKERGVITLDRSWQDLSRRRISAYKLKAKVSSSVSDEFANFMHDRDISTRWSTNSGQQTGDEWILINIPAEEEIDGVFLELGSYKSDFPRGIRIKHRSSCNAVRPDDSDFETIIDYPHWLGPTLYSKNGFPYYGPQGWVNILFPHTIKTGCVLIQQTGESKHFDWSVSEIGFLRQGKIKKATAEVKAQR